MINVRFVSMHGEQETLLEIESPCVPRRDEIVSLCEDSGTGIWGRVRVVEWHHDSERKMWALVGVQIIPRPNHKGQDNDN